MRFIHLFLCSLLVAVTLTTASKANGENNPLGTEQESQETYEQIKKAYSFLQRYKLSLPSNQPDEKTFQARIKVALKKRDYALIKLIVNYGPRPPKHKQTWLENNPLKSTGIVLLAGIITGKGSHMYIAQNDTYRKDQAMMLSFAIGWTASVFTLSSLYRMRA